MTHFVLKGGNCLIQCFLIVLLVFHVVSGIGVFEWLAVVPATVNLQPIPRLVHGCGKSSFFVMLIEGGLSCEEPFMFAGSDGGKTNHHRFSRHILRFIQEALNNKPASSSALLVL